MVPEWLAAGVPAEEVEAWKESVRGADPEVGRKAILEAGGFAAYARALVMGFDLESSAQASALGKLPICALATILCITAMIILVVAVTLGDQDDVANAALVAAATCGAAIKACEAEGKKKQKK